MCAGAVRVMGPLNLDLLRTSIEFVTRRHEALRTRIVVKSDGPYQEIEPVPAHVLSVIDLSDQPSHAHRGLPRLAQEFICTPVELEIGPLFEGKIWRVSDDEHVLVLLIHHIISDGISTGIISREIWECYRQEVLAQPVSLPPLPVQFPDYAVWQAQTRIAWMQKHDAYWRQHLRGASPTVIPADKGLSDITPLTETIKNMQFGDELTAALREGARRERVLLSVFVLAAYAVVLSAWCKTEDLLVSFASHGRHRPALRNVVGFFAHMLPLRIKVNREQTFYGLLAHVKREVATALEHRDFDRVSDLLPECATKVGFNWQSTHSQQGALDHYVATECEYPVSRSFELDFDVKPERSPTTSQLRILPFHLQVPDYATHFIPVIFDTPSTLLMMIAFDPKILAPTTIERFCRNLCVIAKEICQVRTQCITSLLGKIDVD